MKKALQNADDKKMGQTGKYFHILTKGETQILFDTFGDIFSRIFELQLHD